MREFLRNTWARFKPWLERAEHLDFVVGKLSTVAWIIKLAGVPLSAGVIALLLGIVDRTPKALIFLFVLGAVVLALAMILLWKAVTAPTERPKQKTPITKGRKGIKKPEPQSPRPVGISGMLFTSVVTCTILIVGYKYINEHASIDRTQLAVHPAGVLLVGGKIPAFGMNVLWTNKGPLSIENGNVHYHFDFVTQMLTPAEESGYFQEISAFNPIEIIPNELASGKSAWRSFFSDRKDIQDLQAVMDGKMIIYLFMTLQYFVDGNKKLTEFCIFLAKDYPAIHNCFDHNRTYYG